MQVQYLRCDTEGILWCTGFKGAVPLYRQNKTKNNSDEKHCKYKMAGQYEIRFAGGRTSCNIGCTT